MISWALRFLAVRETRLLGLIIPRMHASPQTLWTVFTYRRAASGGALGPEPPRATRNTPESILQNDSWTLLEWLFATVLHFNILYLNWTPAHCYISYLLTSSCSNSDPSDLSFLIATDLEASWGDRRLCTTWPAARLMVEHGPPYDCTFLALCVQPKSSPLDLQGI